MNQRLRVIGLLSCLTFAACGANSAVNELGIPSDTSPSTTVPLVTAPTTLASAVPTTAVPASTSTTTRAGTKPATTSKPATAASAATRPPQSAAKPPAGATFTLGQEFTLGFGEHKSGDGLQVGFIQKAEDSRCPPNSNCFWAGNARVVFQLNRTGTSSTFTLNTMLEPKSVNFNEYTLTLRSLSPASNAPDSSYRATLVITKT